MTQGKEMLSLGFLNPRNRVGSLPLFSAATETVQTDLRPFEVVEFPKESPVPGGFLDGVCVAAG
jgi:hypothetical protein